MGRTEGVHKYQKKSDFYFVLRATTRIKINLHNKFIKTRGRASVFYTRKKNVGGRGFFFGIRSKRGFRSRALPSDSLHGRPQAHRRCASPGVEMYLSLLWLSYQFQMFLQISIKILTTTLKVVHLTIYNRHLMGDYQNRGGGSMEASGCAQVLMDTPCGKANPLTQRCSLRKSYGSQLEHQLYRQTARSACQKRHGAGQRSAAERTLSVAAVRPLLHQGRISGEHARGARRESGTVCPNRRSAVKKTCQIKRNPSRKKS